MSKQYIFISKDTCGIDCTPLHTGNNYTLWVKRKPVKRISNLPATLLEQPIPLTEDIQAGDKTDDTFREEFIEIFDDFIFDFYDPAKPNKELEAYFDQHPEDYQLRDAELSYDALTKKTEAELFNYMRDLFEWVSIGVMEKISMDMINKFSQKSSNPSGFKTYKNARLNDVVKNHGVTLAFIDNLKLQLLKSIKRAENDIPKAIIALKKAFKARSEKRKAGLWFNYDSTVYDINHDPNDLLPISPGSRWGGLGITIHDTMGYRIDLLDYFQTSQHHHFKIKITIYDYFGLDILDIGQRGSSSTATNGISMGKWLPLMVDSDGVLGSKGFIAWYYLQHIRGYRPLLTTLENEYDFIIPLQ